MATVRHRPSLLGNRFSGKKGDSLRDSYRTPDWFYKSLDAEFRFDLDPCPYDPEWSEERVAAGLSIDGLALDWTGKRVWCNPPYSNILPWVLKATTSQALIVMLVPVRSDTLWFHTLLDANAEMRFLRKRIDFTNHEGKKIHPAESSVVAILRRSRSELK